MGNNELRKVMLFMGDNKQENLTKSFIEIDPKGTKIEYYKKKGYDVKEINLEDIKNTVPWNPIENASTEQLKEMRKIVDKNINSK